MLVAENLRQPNQSIQSVLQPPAPIAKQQLSQYLDVIPESKASDFAGFSPCINVFEDDFDYNSSFDDPFNSDFLGDKDFETFSFNDMEEIFDEDHSYSTSETEISEDDNRKHHEELSESLSPIAVNFPTMEVPITDLYYSNSSDEEEYEMYPDRRVRASKLLDLFPKSPRRLFAPNRAIQPKKSALKVESPITYIVSAQNGGLREATKYATELNADNCEGVPLPDTVNDRVYIPAHQTQRNRKKHKKAAIIKAQKIKQVAKKQEISTRMAVGYYSEHQLEQYLTEGKNSSVARGSGTRTLRRFSSCMELDSQDAPVNVWGLQTVYKEKTKQNSNSGLKKSVKWAERLEW